MQPDSNINILGSSDAVQNLQKNQTAEPRAIFLSKGK
jgi:hypothetical protein